MRAAGLLLAAVLACPSTCLAEDWEIYNPLEEESYDDESDIMTNGTAPDTESQVKVKLAKRTITMTWVVVAQTTLDVDGDEWGEHNFGAQSEGTYQIQLWSYPDPGEDDEPRETATFFVTHVE